MNKQQAETVAEALLQPERERQRALQGRHEVRWAWFHGPGHRAFRISLLIGVVSGGVVGPFVHADALLGLFAGLFAGFALGGAVGVLARLVVERRSMP
jgi:hypothetical protein